MKLTIGIIAGVIVILGGILITSNLSSDNNENGNTNETVMEKESELMNIVDTAINAGSFKTLIDSATKAELADTLSNKGPFTVFAPTDAAFAAVPSETLEKLVSDKELLSEVLLYHVVSGSVMADQVVTLDSVETLQGEKLTVEVDGDVMIGNSTVTQTDIKASNGVIHVIDSVLLPQSVINKLNDIAMEEKMNIVETAIDVGSFTTLVAALKAADLVDTLNGDGPFTVFAPTDEAFAKLGEETIQSLLEDKEELSKILTYHVVSGKAMSSDLKDGQSIETVQGAELTVDLNNGVMIGGSKVTQADIDTSNGVIHVIDTVLTP